MTESSKTPDSTPTLKTDAKAPAPAAVLTHPPGKQDKAPSKEPPPKPQKTKRKFALGVSGSYWLVLVFVALMLAGGFATYILADKAQNRRQTNLERHIQAARQEILQASSTQVQAHIQTLSNQIQALQTQLAAEQASQQQLQAEQQSLTEQMDELARALQRLSANGGEAALLHAVEQLVDVAQQQLRLAGNVGQAIIALETAQARLARASFPTLAPLQQAVNGDLERLRALPARDLAQLAAKLDELQQLLMHAPLLSGDWTGEPNVSTQAEDLPSAAARSALSDAEAAPAPQPWWTKAWAATRHGAHQAWQLVRGDLRQLVSIRRIDDPNALLVTSEQAAQLREHLRMRLMMARLALMTAQTNEPCNPQTQLWQTEMQAVQSVIQARFDLHTQAAVQAFNLAGQLAQTSVALDLPHTLDSQQTIQTLTQTLQTRAAQQDAADDAAAGNEAAVGQVESDMGEQTADTPETTDEATEPESRPQVTT